MKIFVDDYRPTPRGWECAHNVTEAIRKIFTSPENIEVIALDHDISESSETFFAVAYFLYSHASQFDILHKPLIYIHTGNPVAAQQMLELLRDKYECKVIDYTEILARRL